MAPITPHAAQRISALWLLSGLWLGLLFWTLRLDTQSVAAQQGLPPNSAVPAVQATEAIQIFMAVLSGVNETPTVLSPATGYALLALDRDNATLSYRLVTKNLNNPTVAHIHVGLPGQTGDVVAPLAIGADGSISGTLTLSPTQVADLQAGAYYINVHTDQHPTGEVRGQLVRFAPPAHYNALLMGSQQVPTVTTNAVGVARFTLVNSDTLHYSIAVSNITDIQAAHLHKGKPGVNNPAPTYTIYTGTGAFSPTHPLTGDLRLNGQGLLDLISGAYYLNIHTVQHPAGEIRGQIGGVRLYAARLYNPQVITTTPALPAERAVFALSADGERLSYRILVTNLGNIPIAAIDLRGMEITDTTAITLYRSNGVSTNPISGSVSLSLGDVQNLAAGKLALKLSTADFPGFTLQGEMQPYTPSTDFRALLTSPSSGQTGGQAAFQLDAQPSFLSYQLTVTAEISPTAAYLRQGAQGEIGPIIATLENQHFVPGQPIAGLLLLDDQNLVDLLTGYLYVTIATATQPEGALRSQVEVSRTNSLTFLPVTLRQIESTPRYKFNIVVVSKCERQPAGNWFEGTVYVNGLPANGYKVVFSYAVDAPPITQPVVTGPHEGYPFWNPGYYSHIINAPSKGPRAGDWYVWIIDDANQRISEIGHWQSTGPGEGCNQAQVDFDSRP